jgi:hypothetical protein
MKEETAVELLKIAANLTASTVNGKIHSASSRADKVSQVEKIFEDCFQAVKSHFDSLTEATK